MTFSVEAAQKWNSYFNARGIKANVAVDGKVRNGAETTGAAIDSVDLSDNKLDKTEIGLLNAALESASNKKIDTTKGIDKTIAQGWKLDDDKEKQTGGEAVEINTDEVTAYDNDKTEYQEAFGLTAEETNKLYNGTSLSRRIDLPAIKAERKSVENVLGTVSVADRASPAEGSLAARYSSVIEGGGIAKYVVILRYLSSEQQAVLGISGKLPKCTDDAIKTKDGILGWWKGPVATEPVRGEAETPRREEEVVLLDAPQAPATEKPKEEKPAKAEKPKSKGKKKKTGTSSYSKAKSAITDTVAKTKARAGELISSLFSSGTKSKKTRSKH